jgi:uncharacterized UPF0160 family protein
MILRNRFSNVFKMSLKPNREVFKVFESEMDLDPTPYDVVTHSGRFHCDEVLGCVLVKYLRDKPVSVLRTRNKDVIQKFKGITIDVGGRYDPDNDKFDHHYPGYNETMRNEIKLSSAGLLYKKYGPQILKNLGFVDLDFAFNELYKTFLQEIDAIDNGQNPSNDSELLYHINTGISKRVNMLNFVPKIDKDPIDNFYEALGVVESDFLA